jgi:hypothetical protein
MVVSSSASGSFFLEREPAIFLPEHEVPADIPILNQSIFYEGPSLPLSLQVCGSINLKDCVKCFVVPHDIMASDALPICMSGMSNTTTGTICTHMSHPIDCVIHSHLS